VVINSSEDVRDLIAKALSNKFARRAVRSDRDMPAARASLLISTLAREIEAAMLQAAADGELTPDEAVSIASLIETRRRTIETVELEARIARLEQGKETAP
jgi:hypothetical protein